VLTRIGLLHPFIHLGFGVEFRQPAIIAEALGQAAVHRNRDGKYLFAVEKAATEPSSKTMPEILEEIRADRELTAAVDLAKADWMGLLDVAPEKVVKYAKQWTVAPGELEKKMAEMTNAVAYYTAAAQHPPKQVRFDFYYLHGMNSSIFLPTFNAQSWLSEAAKLRLLRFKGWLDLSLYASQRSPELLLREVSEYVPAKTDPAQTSWAGVFGRLFVYPDDGHAVKFGRAVASAEQLCRGYEGESWVRIKGDMWAKLGNMIADSLEAPSPGSTWARSVGFEEAWEQFENRPSRL
jgi:hypothetical protein